MTTWTELRQRIAGLGENPRRKNLYADLQRRIGELERFRMLVGQSDEIVVLVDADSGRIVDANEMACRMLACPLETLTGRDISGFIPAVTRDALSAVPFAAGGAHAQEISASWRGGDGRHLPVEMRLRGAHHGGNRYVVITGRERHRAVPQAPRAHEGAGGSAESRLTEALESISDGFALWDADDRLVHWNRQFAVLAPRAVRIEPGLTFGDLMAAVAESTECLDPSVDRHEWVETLTHTHRVGGTRQVQRHNGQWLLCSEHPIDGGVLSLRTDITELKTREAELIEANCRIERQASDLTRLANDLESEIITATRARRQAELANKAKSTFLATMSHELRTPLNAMLGFSEMLNTKELVPQTIEQVMEYAGYIHESGRLLLDIINDILDIAKIETGKFPMAPEQLDVNEVLQSCLRLVTAASEEKRLTFELELPDRPPVLCADRRAFKQILFNLLSNAVKFTPPRGTITVRVRALAPGWFTLMIIDTGIGIPRDRLEAVQRPFERIDNCYSAVTSGAGLGLALVKGLINLHGGRLHLDSEEGKGTTVTVYLPAQPQPAADVHVAEALAN